MNVAIIPAAGSGKRIGGQIAKQFLSLAGAPILIHTLRRFDHCPAIGAIVIALQASEIAVVRAWLSEYGIAKPVRLVTGGAERSDSIFNALQAAREFAPELVAIHDAVRPFVTPAEIVAVLAQAQVTGAAILAQPATDTIKEVCDGTITRTLDRRQIYRAQTPQAFRYDLLVQANEAARNAGLASIAATDDAYLAEQLGVAVAIVEGSPQNFKITTPTDLMLAEILLQNAEGAPQREESMQVSPAPVEVTANSPAFTAAENSAIETSPSSTRAPRAAAIRIGLGNDIHQLVAGRKLILGGVEIPFDKGLLGHSDADALSHALTDAILGAAGLGDIGTHFSDQDPRWQGADSQLFLRHAQALAHERGFVIGNIDATIIAEKPKMLPHIPAMRARLCATLGLAETQLNLKAKTNEKLDAIGRGEAIAVQAVVLMHTV